MDYFKKLCSALLLGNIEMQSNNFGDADYLLSL